MNGWSGKSALLWAELLVLLVSGTVLFDRNADGVDDDGLDLWGPAHPLVPDPLISNRSVSSVTLPSLLLLTGFLSSPRSPPKLLPIA